MKLECKTWQNKWEYSQYSEKECECKTNGMNLVDGNEKKPLEVEDLDTVETIELFTVWHGKLSVLRNSPG